MGGDRVRWPGGDGGKAGEGDISGDTLISAEISVGVSCPRCCSSLFHLPLMEQ